MDCVARAREVIELEIRGLESVRDQIDESFAQAIRMMLTCVRNRGKIVVSGIGKSLHIGHKISATLASTGATSVVMDPAQAIHGDLGVLDPGDVLLALSYTGESEELLNIVPLVRRSGCQIIAVTSSRDNSLAKSSDVVICAAVPREACPFNMAPTTSTTGTLAVGDALAMVLLEARGVRKEDYAMLHPGGAIGRTLLLRAADIMRRDDRVPRVTPSQSVRDALLAMTRARSGSCGVVDEAGRVVGIFTDGDLRRHLSGDTLDVMNLTIDKLMTEPPVTVREHQFAVDVLRVFENHSIDDLLVVDSENRLVGAIDIQDLPKLKIL
jgi:arabinose-5-phosphate isomerase